MKLSLTPVDVPFKVGDTVWVDQPFGATHEFPYFQGVIMQIILDGSLANTLVTRQPEEKHALSITNAIYGLKPIGDHAGSPRVNVNVQLIPLQISLFETKDQLMEHQNQFD
ncbi:hypothetical protein [Spirosoma endophyticum]|uniref:Uncharacterized protein n=1 Tax=Spirosoma endophyticum TaxID=662367 RepID=A0A1I2E8N2_9BACT|nr:hypothetical protein [Spirosoma endophyticum]SFE88966.1 hypothetical protein SAMN05216167_12157 [Spirosoma endophyticum]